MTNQTKLLIGIHNYYFRYTELIQKMADYYKEQISEIGSSWIDLLVRFSKRERTKVEGISNFTFGDVHEKTQRLIARFNNNEQYLLSPNLEVIERVSNTSDFSFLPVNELQGVYFDFDINGRVWKMTCENPYLKTDSKLDS